MDAALQSGADDGLTPVARVPGNSGKRLDAATLEL
jgi:hypothetical protein